MKREVKALIWSIPLFIGRRVQCQELRGGLTNRNFRLTSGDDSYVLRIASENSKGLGINRETERASAQTAHAVGIGPEVLAFSGKDGMLLRRFIEGRVLTPASVGKPDMLQCLAKSLRRYHESGRGKGVFSVFKTVRRYYTEAKRNHVSFPPEICFGLESLERIEQQVGPSEYVCPCHNDLLASNFIYDGQKLWILDWEYAARGDLFFDFGNLAANNRFDDEQERTFLRHYFGRARETHLRRLHLMRLASDMREAMWGFLQMGFSSLDCDYRSYAHRHLRRFLRNVKLQAAKLRG